MKYTRAWKTYKQLWNTASTHAKTLFALCLSASCRQNVVLLPKLRGELQATRLKQRLLQYLRGQRKMLISFMHLHAYTEWHLLYKKSFVQKIFCTKNLCTKNQNSFEKIGIYEFLGSALLCPDPAWENSVFVFVDGQGILYDQFRIFHDILNDFLSIV